MATDPTDPFAARLAVRAPELLRDFNRAGVLDAADVQVTTTLGRLSGVDDPRVLLAVAMAVRAPRLGHVFVDLASVDQTVIDASADADGASAPQPNWPDAESWVQAVAGSTQLVSRGAGVAVSDGVGDATADSEPRPLRLDGSRLYLTRYWQEERALAVALSELAESPLRQLDLARLAAQLGELFPNSDDRLQRAAAAAGVLRGLTVIAGGPGTGKTTTVARLVALLFERAARGREPAPLIGLVAPTGKAAARLTEAIRTAADELQISEDARGSLRGQSASTIHRLLGWLPGGRFRHSAANHLPHDVVIVDETSMVPLSLMVCLAQAVRRDAQLIMVGDPDQLTAIEAGAVLRDIVGPASREVRFGAGFKPILERATGDRWHEPENLVDPVSARSRSFGDGVVMLRRGHRFGVGIAALADAIRDGDADRAVEAAGAGGEIIWYPTASAAEATPATLAALRDSALTSYGALIAAARAGDARAALVALSGFRLLCAHRRGPQGVSQWTGWVERLLAETITEFEPSERNYAGRPLLITENDHELRLNNGDTGVIVHGLGAVFERDGSPTAFAPARLAAVETMYAMTVHKSQGSQFDVAAFVLPEPASRILTRELVYTAVTRARSRLILVGSQESLRAAVQRPVARATGLGELLWDAR